MHKGHMEKANEGSLEYGRWQWVGWGELRGGMERNVLEQE